MGFQYQALKPDEIRLLKPLSRSSESLSFEIIHTSLLSKPRYTALSYTRGPPGDTHEVLLNGHQFPIRQNLSDALQQIQFSELVNKYLWIDAICINQSEQDDALRERGIQVTRMKEIYDLASKIIVWLGNPENEINNQLAVRMMKHFKKRMWKENKKDHLYHCLANTDLSEFWKPRTNHQLVADFNSSLSPSTDRKIFDVPGSQTYKAWLGVISLWKSPWWSRTWAYLESTKPERYTIHYFLGFKVSATLGRVRFLCGGQETSWNAFAATRLVSLKILSAPGLESYFLTDAVPHIPYDKIWHFMTERENAAGSLLHILQTFRHTLCLDPRDKVYAPLCIAPIDVRRYIKPDYANKTVLDVYKDAISYHLVQPGQNLDFLGYTLYSEKSQIVKTPQGAEIILPSWVPNFSVSLDVIPIPKILHIPKNLDPKSAAFYDRRGISGNKELLAAAYRPLGDFPSKLYIENNLLYASGVNIDAIKDLISYEDPDKKAAIALAEEKRRKWAIESKQRYFTGESYADAMNRTLVLDLIYDDQGRPSERGGKVDSGLERRPRAELSVAEQRFQKNMQTSKSRASALRILGLSRNLHLLYVPNTAVVGDMVWALAGGEALYVLRAVDREKGRYRFVGECYAHGLMDGEVVRQLRAGKVKMEDISLL